MRRTLSTLIIALTIISAAFANSRVIENPVYEFSNTAITNVAKIDHSLEPVISLNSETMPRCREIPDEILQWINNELAQARRKTMMDFAAGEFFATDTVRLVGYIRGYDRHAGFSTGMLFNRNEITREDNLAMVQVHEDGRFEAVFSMSYPKYTYVLFTLNPYTRVHIPFYIQPGQTVAMILDWDEFLMADQLRDEPHPYTFRNIQFKGGIIADINNELSAFKAQLPVVPIMQIFDGMDDRNPDEFKLFLDEAMLEYNNTFRRLLATESLSERTKTLLKNNFQLLRSQLLLTFVGRYRWHHPLHQIPIEFYSFLQNIPMNNRELLSVQDFSSFIAQFEFAQPFEAERQVAVRTFPRINFVQYLFYELDIPRTPEDEVFLTMREYTRNLNFMLYATPEERAEWVSANDELRERHQEHFIAWQRKYVDVLPPPLSPLERELKRWEIRDSVFTHVLNLEPGIVYDITKIRRLGFQFLDMSRYGKEHHLNLLIALAANISEPFLRQEVARLFIQNLPATQQQIGEELPDTYAANMFRELIAPFRGKTVLVNFWATVCAPCVLIIRRQQELRDRYKDSPEIAFVFITCEVSTPLSEYEEFVKEQGLTHSFRLSVDQMNHFRELFHFLGVPRYVLVDRQGRILDDNFRAGWLNVSEPLLPQLLN